MNLYEDIDWMIGDLYSGKTIRNRKTDQMNHDKITADIRRKVAEFVPKKPKLISHTVIPFYANGKWRVQIQDNKPELKRRFH